MSDLGDILEGNKASPSEQKQADKANQARDEEGKFAKGEKVEAEAKAAPEKEVKAKEAPQASEADEPNPDDSAPPAEQEKPNPRESAFLAKANDEKEKRQKAEKRAEELLQRQMQLERELAALKAPPPPDLKTDPEGHVRHVQQAQAAQAFDQKLNISERYARKAYGDDAVTEAQYAFKEAGEKMPALFAMLQQQDDPYDFVVKWHKREKLLAEIGDDVDAWKTKMLTPAQEQQRQAPPRSLANASSARNGVQSPDTVPLSGILGR